MSLLWATCGTCNTELQSSSSSSSGETGSLGLGLGWELNLSRWGEHCKHCFAAHVYCCFIADILLNFRTTFVSRKGEVVSNSKQIAINYFRGWFALDLLAALPFDHLYASDLYDGEVSNRRSHGGQRPDNCINLSSKQALNYLCQICIPPVGFNFFSRCMSSPYYHTIIPHKLY